MCNFFLIPEHISLSLLTLHKPVAPNRCAETRPLPSHAWLPSFKAACCFCKTMLLLKPAKSTQNEKNSETIPWAVHSPTSANVFAFLVKFIYADLHLLPTQPTLIWAVLKQISDSILFYL